MAGSSTRLLDVCSENINANQNRASGTAEQSMARASDLAILLRICEARSLWALAKVRRRPDGSTNRISRRRIGIVLANSNPSPTSCSIWHSQKLRHLPPNMKETLDFETSKKRKYWLHRLEHKLCIFISCNASSMKRRVCHAMLPPNRTQTTLYIRKKNAHLSPIYYNPEVSAAPFASSTLLFIFDLLPFLLKDGMISPSLVTYALPSTFQSSSSSSSSSSASLTSWPTR